MNKPPTAASERKSAAAGGGKKIKTKNCEQIVKFSTLWFRVLNSWVLYNQETKGANPKGRASDKVLNVFKRSDDLC